MKAVIMAGGAGTRGRPYTDHIPKAMTRVEGRPIVERIVRHICASRNIDEIIVITDLKGLGGQVRNYLEGAKLECPITFVQDSSSGTAGDLLHAQRKIGSGSFVLWFSDNLCAIDIDAMIELYKTSRRTACVAVRSKRKEETGFVRVDQSRVTEFVEKPTITLAMPECLGVYVMDAKLLKDVRRRAASKSKVNLSYDILEPLAASMELSAYDIGSSHWLDVESPTILERNSKTVSRILVQMKRCAMQMRAGGLRAHRRQSHRRARA